jgi:hypothetical protein
MPRLLPWWGIFGAGVVLYYVCISPHTRHLSPHSWARDQAGRVTPPEPNTQAGAVWNIGAPYWSTVSEEARRDMSIATAETPVNISATPISVLLHRAESMRWSWEEYAIEKVFFVFWIVGFSAFFLNRCIVPVFHTPYND